MKFLKFLKFGKEKTTEELFRKCEDSFYEFCSYIHLSHTEDYFRFKKQFSEDANYCIAAIVEVKNDALKRKLINHLQQQVDYIQDNCFGPNSRIKFREFLDANYPYEEKVNEIIKNHKFEQAIVDPLQEKRKLKI
jgi:hypothetical protein